LHGAGRPRSAWGILLVGAEYTADREFEKVKSFPKARKFGSPMSKMCLASHVTGDAMKRIPSTQALRALDSFARHGSVWRAADELNLTRSAVSHQLRLLERDLGFDLPERVGKGVALATRGRRDGGDVRQALTVVSAAAGQPGDGIGGALTISCTPGFASLWLCTHIGEFVAACPDVSLRVVTPRRLDDVSDPQADGFIAFGDGNWPNRAVELLCDIE